MLEKIEFIDEDGSTYTIGKASIEKGVKVYIGGDSAGGNLTLTLIAWVRDQALRQPDAAVALSPVTDGTFTSPTLKSNMDTDDMLGPLFRDLAKVPVWILLWVSWLQKNLSRLSF